MTHSLMPGGVTAPIKPLAPYDDRPGDTARDFAGTGSYSIYALERMLRSCAQQPPWRLRAKLCAAYYDGKQLDELRRYLLRLEDIDERVVNLIRPIVNSVLGAEARSRTDVRVEADSDEYADVAEVLSLRLKEAERETYAHQAVSNAYASMVKKGLGWLHVCRNADPLAYPYRFEDVPIEEVWWDWHGQQGFRLDDRCRWLCRQRMIDLDELIAAMPQHRKILELTASGWTDPRLTDTGGLLGEPDELELRAAYDHECRFNSTFSKWDWFDSARRTIKVIEVWYRVPAIVTVLQLSATKRVEFNPRDPRHVEAVARGIVKVVKGPSSRVRQALYAGPHRLIDRDTGRKRFPYIPMFAYRDDEDGSPYGMIDGMIAPQDDYNDRRHRIQWMLKARQLFVDNDALDTSYNSIADVADMVNRPDLVAVLNANRRNANGMRIENTLSLQKEQFNLLSIAENDVQKAAGRYASNLGNAQVQSGVANSLLIEQGEQAMGEMNDNYVYARREAFDQLVDLIREDHMEPDQRVHIGHGRSRRVVILNTWEPRPVVDEKGDTAMQPAMDPTTGQPAVDPATGQPVMEPVMGPPTPKNFVADADVVTSLAEVPNTPAYRSQTQQQLKEVITALAGNAPALAALAPAYIETTTLPNREEVANDLRDATGMPRPGDRKGREQARAQQQASMAEANEIAKQQALAKVEEAAASAELKKAQARKALADAAQIEAQLKAGIPQAMADASSARAGQAPGAIPDPTDAAVDEALQEAAAVTT